MAHTAWLARLGSRCGGTSCALGERHTGCQVAEPPIVRKGPKRAFLFMWEQQPREGQAPAQGPTANPRMMKSRAYQPGALPEIPTRGGLRHPQKPSPPHCPRGSRCFPGLGTSVFSRKPDTVLLWGNRGLSTRGPPSSGPWPFPGLQLEGQRPAPASGSTGPETSILPREGRPAGAGCRTRCPWGRGDCPAFLHQRQERLQKCHLLTSASSYGRKCGPSTRPETGALFQVV